ncbi:DUF4390 domain-containing protein [Candidatus Thiothrix sp. Deng01]|uniref:DUF4390 domain-containing protein n=1 Tax=Candidatus Thiothrix phosphatis TaxID=3112415 RepID=A0ABU6D169_9GAMM|nr:DUF4390 domain-containing protein [Candidatus Thiothrix sp. Deng01]MEB4592532.1 DUF4390 domain-containing protein [Candidatus Thiothrix sp. Deng01]
MTTATISRFYRLLAGLALICLLGLALAADSSIRFREFSIRNINQPRVLVNNLQLEYQLTDYLREGLVNGMTLENEILFTLEWHHTWWWNSQKHLATVRTELKYHPLSKQYQVVQLDSGETWNFPNLPAALEQLGRLEDYRLPNLPANAYHSDASIFVTAKLSPKSLKLPLKLQELFTDRYSLQSDGVLWPIP